MENQNRYFIALDPEYRDKIALLIGVEYQNTRLKTNKKTLIQALIDRALDQAKKEKKA